MDEPSGTSRPRVSSDNKSLQQTQAKVDEVVGVMRDNVEKVSKRDQILSELVNPVGTLEDGASQFTQQAGKLKRKYWWQNMKMMLTIGAIGVLLIIIIVWATSGGSTASAPAATTVAPAINNSGTR